jgi:hypothetical protein
MPPRPDAVSPTSAESSVPSIPWPLVLVIGAGFMLAVARLRPQGMCLGCWVRRLIS